MKIVLVSGGFDPINGRGHMSHISEAMKIGNWLVLALMTDEQLILKKGYTFYPSYKDRLCIMKGIVGDKGEVIMQVDEGVTSCAETIRLVKPNIFAKGGDRNPKTMPKCEIEACKEIGCKIVYGVGDDKVQSSSGLIEAVRAK